MPFSVMSFSCHVYFFYYKFMKINTKRITSDAATDNSTYIIALNMIYLDPRSYIKESNRLTVNTQPLRRQKNPKIGKFILISLTFKLFVQQRIKQPQLRNLNVVIRILFAMLTT